MVEPLVILDINSSMRDLLGKTEREVVNKPARDEFPEFPISIKSCIQVTYARVEAEFELEGNIVHYEWTSGPSLTAARN